MEINEKTIYTFLKSEIRSSGKNAGINFLSTLFLFLIHVFSVHANQNISPDSTGIPPDSISYTTYIFPASPSLNRSEINILLSLIKGKEKQSSIVFLGAEQEDLLKRKSNSSETSENEKLTFLLRKTGANLIVMPDDAPLSSQQYSDPDDELPDSLNVVLPPAYTPALGCPGPVEIPVNPLLTVVAVNSAWWHHPTLEGISPAGCDNPSDEQFLNDYLDILQRERGKYKLVLIHHPLRCYGNRGGHFTWKDHLFPLRHIHPSLYIPLPVIGSAYPLFRMIVGGKKDIAYAHNRDFIEMMAEANKGEQNLIVASGHDQGFQYFNRGNITHLVQGSCGNDNYVKTLKSPGFSSGKSGFFRLLLTHGGDLWLEAWVMDENNTGKKIFSQKIKDHSDLDKPDIYDAAPVPTDSAITIAVGPEYKAGKVKQLFFGKHYRDEWVEPVNFPVLDMDREKGGLIAIKKGGGQQTTSLRLKAGDGKEYVVRSIQKDPSSAVPKILRKTFAKDVAQDQVSAGHPYSAFIVPDLAEAAGIYHTYPRRFILPDHPHLGPYRKEFAGMPVLFELRLDGDQTDQPSLGYSRNLVSTFKVLRNMRKDNDNRVDDYAVVRARLFDMLLGDWDRHDDQWRWAESKTKKGAIYRPIPRDRDQVFFRFDGVIPWLFSRSWGFRQFNSFEMDIANMANFNSNARHFDRSFINKLSASDWQSIADSMKNGITDEVIEKSIRQLPPQIFSLHGEDIIRKLKSRRNLLNRFADRYYKLLSRNVRLFGSDKNEWFEIERLDDLHTRVRIYKMSKRQEKEELLYDRTFLNKETKELNIYGFGGKDYYNISGDVRNSLLVRIIASEGTSTIEERSNVKKAGKQTKIYDPTEKTFVTGGNELRLITTRHPNIPSYDRKEFTYPVVAPALFFGYNEDDGILLGGGISIRTHGFRKKPYASFQKLTMNVAWDTSAYNLVYNGDFRSIIGLWDANISFKLLGPNYLSNYFGLGNETKEIYDDDSYYRLRYKLVELFPTMVRRLSGLHEIEFGPRYQFIRIDNSIPNRFINQPEAGLKPSDFRPFHFAGLGFNYRYSNTDDKLLIRQGLKFNFKMRSGTNLRNYSETFVTSSVDISGFFTTAFKPHITIGARVGVAHNFGKFRFFQANTIGGLSDLRESGNLRSFNRNRFSGRTSAYQNLELRLKLFDMNTYVFQTGVGMMLFVDQGRVWADGEESGKWHRSYGAGLWISPFDKIVITSYYGVSAESDLLIVKLGFFF